MTRTPKIEVMIFCLLSLLVLMLGIQVVDGYSQTFTNTLFVSYWGYSQQSFHFCNLQAGDRIQASFTLNNLGPYTVSLTELPQYIISHDGYYKFNISFSLLEEIGKTPRDILNFTETKGDSFDYTAVESGDYWIHFTFEHTLGGSYLDAKDPVLTINYDIIKAGTTIPPTASPTIQPIATPTMQPTANPTTKPAPTIQPTTSPTIQPTPPQEMKSEGFPTAYAAGAYALIFSAAAIIAVAILKHRQGKKKAVA